VQLVPCDGQDQVEVHYRNFVIAKIDAASGELVSRNAYRVKVPL